MVVEPVKFIASVADKIDLGGGGGTKYMAANRAECALSVVDWPSSTLHVSAMMPW